LDKEAETFWRYVQEMVAIDIENRDQGYVRCETRRERERETVKEATREETNREKRRKRLRGRRQTERSEIPLSTTLIPLHSLSHAACVRAPAHHSHSLDEVEAHRFLEKLDETLTVLALRSNLRKSGALGEKERPKRVPLTHCR
jgi:hypothetical protein